MPQFPVLRRVLAATLAIGLVAAFTVTTAQAQGSYPNKPIKFLVGYPPGGPTDIWSRMIAKRLQDKFGQPVIVENRAGAGGTLALAAMAREPADALTLMFGGLVFASEVFHANLPYNPRQDFQAIGGVYRTPFYLAVPTDFPARTVQEFLAYAKANPGKINFAAGTNSGMMMAEMMRAKAKVETLVVPYKGNAPALTALLAGEVQAGFDQLGPLKPQVAAGKLRLLAVTAAKRTADMPDLPTFAEAGLPDMVVETASTVWVRRGSPPDAIAQLSAALREMLDAPEFVERRKIESADPFPATPEEAERQVDADFKFWTEAARTANYKPGT